jgi:hypothetical protein
MMKVTGFDQVARQFEELTAALKSLDGDLATVSFDPNQPESIDQAIRVMEETIDRKVAPYRNNQMVGGIVSELKAKYRAAIRERADEARVTAQTQM